MKRNKDALASNRYVVPQKWAVGTKGGWRRPLFETKRFDIDCILALLPNTSSEHGTLKSKL